jgi:DNA recombination protein RmuC
MSDGLQAFAAGGPGFALALACAVLAGIGLGALVAGLVGHARAQRAETQATERAQQLAAAEIRAEAERRAFEQRLEGERRHAQQQLALARGEIDTLRSHLVGLERERATLEADFGNAERATAEKLALLENAEKQLREAFTALSADALRANSQSFLDLAKTALGETQQTASADLAARQGAIDALLKPVVETLGKVDAQLRAVETARHGHYRELKQHLELVAQSHQHLHGETRNLVQALRAPNVRGRWGEIQLRRVVELAGMLEHCDFTEQASVATETGRLRPDLLIQLPGGKHVVVDAKAPLDAYLDAAACAEVSARAVHLRRHAQQVREHMSQLGAKQYWAQFQATPEFVVMFLPGETFFAAALEQDPALIEWGAERSVIVSSPTTLIALLRAVAYGWQQERVAHNAEAIRQLGRELHERITTMADHFARIGQRLDDAVGAYNATLGSFETRVLVSARRLKELGAGSSGEIPEATPIERDVRRLRSAPVDDRDPDARGQES